MNSFYHLIPLIIQNYPHILQNVRLKTGSYVLFTRGTKNVAPLACCPKNLAIFIAKAVYLDAISMAKYEFLNVCMCINVIY